jgi:hypothetical protein
LKSPERPVLILLQGGEGAAAQRTLERAGYQVLAVGEVADVPERPQLKLVKPRARRSGSGTMLMSTSRAARLLRASPFALNRWRALGWLRSFGSSNGWNNLVDLREAVLLTWLRNGPDCVSDDLARLVQRPGRDLKANDPCLVHARAWKSALGALAGPSFETAIRELHECGYACREIEDCVARLAPQASA